MKQKLELWLVRHGQTTWNLSRRISGWSDVPLTDLGREQAQNLAPLLADKKFDSVWSSDLVRATETAVLAYGEDFTKTDGLREINFGNHEGQSWGKLDEKNVEEIMEFKSYCAPGGESIATFEARIKGFIENLSEGRHLLFCHGGVVRALTYKLGLDRFLSNCGLAVVDWSGQELICVKEMGS